MKITIFSGKGGTGKTTVSSSLILGLKEREKDFSVVDADVDCPNLSILFSGRIVKKGRMYLGYRAKGIKNIKESIGFCPFDAIKEKKGKVYVDKDKCEGCGACVQRFPNGFKLIKKYTGMMYLKDMGFPLSYAQLSPGSSGSGKLVDALIEAVPKKDVIVIDAPAGTGCPVISAIKTADIGIGVVEPTRISINSLERTIRIAKHFGIDWYVVGNKKGMNKKIERKIEGKFRKRFIGWIEFNKEIPKMIGKGIIPYKITKTTIKKILDKLGL